LFSRAARLFAILRRRPVVSAVAAKQRRRKRGTRIPGPARGFARVVRSAGPVGGNEAKAGYRWQGEPQRVRFGGAPCSSAATEFVLQFDFLRMQEFRVVKIRLHRCWKRGRKASDGSLVPPKFTFRNFANPGGEEGRLLRSPAGAPASPFPWK